ncbi:MAG: hypothetical protein PVI91_07625 [Gammaproteobacteria bacterium]|jgi:hypothetical protein
MSGVLSLLVSLGALLSVGCAQQPPRPAEGDASSLQHWLDTELAPYLAEQLAEHPRFKGESLILVSLDGPDIQPEIDGLTRRLRDQLMDDLLAEAGVRLPWQAQQRQAEHHRRLDRVSCQRIRDADYYVGIEISRSATARYRVSVRALDVRAGEWVSGFGQSWSGTLTPGELRALQERRSDESLRGLRVLPFSAEEPDLAASYLANNLSCLLRQGEEEDLVIYVESLQSDEPGLSTLLDLIGNNLSRYREVRVTDVRKEAGFLLYGEVHEVQAGLYQVWVVLRPRNSGEHLAGMDTATYVRVSSTAGGVARSRKPAIAGMELVRRTHRGSGAAGCEGDRADRSGGDRANDCPELELTVEGADRVFVFVHGILDGASRLSSGDCSEADEGPAAIQVKRRYRFPAARFSPSDWPTVYAIAVSGPKLAGRLEALLQALPDACGSASGLRAGDDALDPWLDELDRLIAANGEQAVWTARRIP